MPYPSHLRYADVQQMKCISFMAFKASLDSIIGYLHTKVKNTTCWNVNPLKCSQ